MNAPLFVRPPTDAGYELFALDMLTAGAKPIPIATGATVADEPKFSPNGRWIAYHANEGGSATFFVSNNKTGTIAITDSTLKNNPKGKFETPGFPGMYVIAKTAPVVTNSTRPLLSTLGPAYSYVQANRR